MYRFLVVYEKGNQNYSAYLPDLPGCIAVGDSLEDVKKGIREAIKLHLEGMIEDQEPIPTPQTTASYINIAFPDSSI
jgi:predicted RNase H-like HicB family nuclease